MDGPYLKADAGAGKHRQFVVELIARPRVYIPSAPYGARR
jgi:hypothetical protein